MKKRAFGVALVVTASLVAVPSAAQAAYTCQSGEVCIFQDYDLKGSVLIIYSGTHNFTSNWVFANGDPVNDNASSIINRTSHVAFAYEEFDKQGLQISGIWPNGQMNFKGRGILQELRNDSMSSIYIQP
ncbi:hypothetical protein GCM10010435_27780 [Winogradskya consettensis]|uniref:Peptidase inhibitor family I36 n=1 Tax=Winogradskya consettensis TaxID=113560 RepID=A0A919SFW2_9ACTN|nr:peptidase inhibitor family I36 protein [Actinoplanes consettensis]GIM71090.1 hypothetical protein Aco04nite_23720 [Actinoplanes consettensis]